LTIEAASFENANVDVYFEVIATAASASRGNICHRNLLSRRGHLRLICGKLMRRRRRRRI